MFFRHQIALFLDSKFFKNFSIIFIFDIFSKFFTALIFWLTIRLLSQKEYALFVKFNSLANLLFGIFASGIGIAYVRCVSDSTSIGRFSIVKKMYLFSLILVLVILFPIFFCSQFLSNVYKLPLMLVILSLFYTLTLSYLKLNQFYFQGQEMYSVGGFIDLIRIIAILFSILAIYLFSANISVHCICLVFIICGFVSWVIFSGKIFSTSKFNFGKREFLYAKLFLKESAWLLFYCFMLAFLGQSDIILLSRLAPDMEIANYGVAQKYQALTLSMLPALLALMRVKTAKRDFSNDLVKRQEFTRKWIKSTTPYVVVLILSGAFLSRYVLPLLNGSQYDAAIPLFQIMLIGVGISYVFSPNVPVLMAAKRFPVLCVLCFISLLITFVGNYLLIPSLGAVAPAIFFVISNAFLNICATVFIFLDTTSRTKRKETDVSAT